MVDRTASESPQALPATEVLVWRISWLVRLRWLAVAGSLFFIELARRVLPIDVALTQLLVVLALLASYNLGAELLLARLRRAAAAREARGEPADTSVGRLAHFLLPQTPPDLQVYDARAAQAAVLASVQIVVDLVFLAAMLHFSGGVENPLWDFLIFHVIVASILLSGPATYGVATLGIVLMGAVVFGEYSGVLRHYPLHAYWQLDGYLNPHIVGARVFLSGVTLYVGAYLASSIAGRLRRRELDVVVLARHLEAKNVHLQEAFEDLEAAERAKSHYMRKVAHELRVPLGTIKTALSVALRTAPDSLAAQTRELIQRAERRAGDMAEMVRELLSLSLVRGSEERPEAVPVDLWLIAEEILDEMGPRAEEAEVQLSTRVAEGLPQVMGSPQGLGDLLRNLLGNAIRYTPAGGRVELRLQPEGQEILLEVEDTGIGIPEEDQVRVFEEFYRSFDARQLVPGGSGLGLTIVKAVVDQHGGRIAIRSREGKGTCMRVWLPAA